MYKSIIVFASNGKTFSILIIERTKYKVVTLYDLGLNNIDMFYI